jgi:hypothetical protein
MLIESGTLIIELVSQDTRHQLYQTCHFAVTSALILRRQNINFGNSNTTSLRKYLNFKRTGQEKKIRILHTKKISGEISAAFTRMFSIVIILKITVSEANYTLLHLKTSCLVSSIFVTMEEIPGNAADISHVRPLSKICILLEISRGSTTVLKDSEI